MSSKWLTATSTQEDLTYGQHVIVTARWILVLAGLMLALWNPGPLPELRIQVIFILLLAVANFFLHAQLLMGRPAIAGVVYLASAADLIVITVMVLLGHGFESSTYVFFFPAILAFSVAFPPVITFIYASSATGFYTVVSLLTMNAIDGDTQTVLARAIIMAAVAVCGALYWRIETRRRIAAARARTEVELMRKLRPTKDVARPAAQAAAPK